MSRSIRQIMNRWPLVFLGLSLILSFQSVFLSTIALIAGIGVAAVLHVRSGNKKKLLVLTPWDILMWLFVLIEVFSYFNSSLRSNSGFFLDLVALAIAGFYFVRCTDMRGEAALRDVGVLLSLTGICWVVITLYNFFLLKSDSVSESFIGLGPVRNQITPLIGSNQWSLFLMLFFPFAMSLALSDNKRLLRGIGTLCSAGIAVSILLLFSRGAYLAMILYLISFSIGVVLIGSAYVKRAVVLMTVVLISMGCTAVFQWVDVCTTLQMNVSVSQQRSSDARYELWDAARDIWEDYPVFGVGFGNFPLEYYSRKPPESDGVAFGAIPSALVQLTAEKGSFGLVIPFVVALMLYVFGIRYLSRNRKEQLLSAAFALSALCLILPIAVREATMSTLLTGDFVYWQFVLVYILTANIVFEAIPGVRKKWLMWCIAGSTLGFFLLISGIKYSKITTKKAMRGIQAEMRRGDVDLASNQAAELMKKIPSNPLGWANHARLNLRCDSDNWDGVFSCDGDPITAVNSIDRSLELEPRDETLWFAKGWYSACAGRYDMAIDAIQFAAEADRSLYVYPLVLGMVMEKADGNVDRASEYYARALALDPDLFLSQFARELELRHPGKMDSILEISLEYLSGQDQSPITIARTGACHFYLGELDRSEVLFEEASRMLPGMNRPYFYLGAIELTRSDTSATHEYWTKALFLDRRDKLVSDCLSELNTNSEGASEVRPAVERARAYRDNEPFYLKRRVYYQDYFLVTNTVLSKGFMRYINPGIDRFEGGSLQNLLGHVSSE